MVRNKEKNKNPSFFIIPLIFLGKSNKYGYLDPIFTDDFSDKEIRDHLTNFAFAVCIRKP